MAKELDKFKKEWAKVSKDIASANEEIKKNANAVAQASGVRNEGCLQLGLEIQRCKDNGMQGKTVYDFDSDNEVKACLKSINDYQAQLEKELKRMSGVVDKDFKKLKDSFWKLKSGLKEEIDKRDKKKNRKVAAVDSKSLPDLQKLYAEIDKATDREFAMVDVFVVEDIKSHDKELAGNLEDAVKQSKEQKLSKFQQQMMTQGLDERVMNKNLKSVINVHKVVIGHCMVCEEAIKARQNKFLMENKVLAAKEFKKLAELVDPYFKAEKDGFLKKKIQGASHITKGLAAMHKMHDEAKSELTKIANARLDKG